MKKTFNFSAGPAVLPKDVLLEASVEMLNYRNCGMSVMEISHRSALFEEILNETRNNLRVIMDIPENYEILFLQGGTSLQFSMIPMNFMKNKIADYIVTGQWSKKAADEASRYGTVNIVATSSDKQYSYIPDCSNLPINDNSDYLYMCENNTIYGTKFKRLPNSKGKTIINDISSCFLSEPIRVSDYGMLYGGVQKNVGPAGLVIAIIRKDLISDSVLAFTPTMMKYHLHAQNNSLYNTPPVYTIYIVGKVLKWIIEQGGVTGLQKRNQKKADLLYNYLDQSSLFYGLSEKESRSLMNVTFRTKSDETNEIFLHLAEEVGIVNLKGHRSIGGMRASLYNAMPLEGVQYLIDFMEHFEKRYK